mmetsp:Transcript_24193/g.76054  ORF Transcript_24193/g.76054 Transcript_24193/m.76054 type:complete len:306 (+) Transcript_24193:3157-4074(+)
MMLSLRHARGVTMSARHATNSLRPPSTSSAILVRSAPAVAAARRTLMMARPAGGRNPSGAVKDTCPPLASPCSRARNPAGTAEVLTTVRSTSRSVPVETSPKSTIVCSITTRGPEMSAASTIGRRGPCLMAHTSVASSRPTSRACSVTSTITLSPGSTRPSPGETLTAPPAPSIEYSMAAPLRLVREMSRTYSFPTSSSPAKSSIAGTSSTSQLQPSPSTRTSSIRWSGREPSVPGTAVSTSSCSNRWNFAISVGANVTRNSCSLFAGMVPVRGSTVNTPSAGPGGTGAAPCSSGCTPSRRGGPK